ncbi:hypothetical protein D3C85_239720 [compost metagenome]
MICPAIWLGRPLGSLMRFSAIHALVPSGLAPPFWSNCTVVCFPTLKLSQFRIALSSVCSMPTTVRPPAAVCTGALALSQPAVRLWVSTLSPPSARPSGMSEPPFDAASRAAACAACCAAMERAAMFRLPMERCNCSPALRCSSGLVSIDAGMPLGRRPVAEAVFCTALLLANQAPLKACWAWASSTSAPLAASVMAMARAIGAMRKRRACRRLCAFVAWIGVRGPRVLMSRFRRKVESMHYDERAPHDPATYFSGRAPRPSDSAENRQSARQ